jgi:hypothetical protein
MLDTALDFGIKEERFWNMTIAEIQREVKSVIRVRKLESQEKASYDYILANLIVKGVAKCLGDKSEYPTIEKAYPNLFDDIAAEREQKIQEQKMNLSAIRFKQFAQSYNKNFKNKEVRTINE